MSYVFTPWGYEADGLPPIVTAAQFNVLTANRHADKSAEQLEFAIAAASQAVRNVCGWHVSPSLTCRVRLSSDGGRVLALPAAVVTEVDHVSECGQELAAGQYEVRQDGLLRRACFKSWPAGWNTVEAVYTAGLDVEAAADIASAVVHIVEAALSVPVGIASETAGGVSIAYRADVSAIAAMTAAQMAGALSAYKVVSAHAA